MAAGMGKVELFNRDLRENFKVAALMIAHANNKKVDEIDLNELTQGYVLSMIDARINQNSLRFPITTLDLPACVGAPLLPMMNIVAQTDSFVAGKMGYYLMMYQYAGGNQQTPDYTQPTRMQPITFPGPYSSAGESIWEFAPGNMIFWHANISIEVNGIKLYKQWECMQHLYVPRGQATPSVANAIYGTGSSLVPTYVGASNASPYQPGYWNEFDGGNDAFYPMEPLPVFSGMKNSVVNLNLPAQIPGTIAPFTTFNYGTTFILKICLHLRGILAQNSTSAH